MPDRVAPMELFMKILTLLRKAQLERDLAQAELRKHDIPQVESPKCPTKKSLTN